MKGEGLAQPEILLARWRGEGRVPLGQGAQAAFAEIRDTVRPIVEQLLKHGPGEGEQELAPVRRELVLSPEITLQGELIGRYPSGHVYWTNSLLHGKILLPVWLGHLFLSAVAPKDQRCETIVIGRGRDKGTAQVFRLSPVRESAAILLDLASLFVDGANVALPFFPKSAYAFARTIASGKGSEKEQRIVAFARAQEEYLGNDFAPGEGEDPYCRQLFGDVLPVSPAFAELAVRIFTPTLNHLEEL
jgi:exodeoxyribonuclease V gamma subunit